DAADPDAVLVRNFGQCTIDLLLGRLRAVARRFWWLRERNPTRGALGHVHVDRSHRPDLVRIRLGNPATGDRFPVDLPMSVARRAAVPEVQAAHSGHLAFSLARFSHHDWCGSDQIARGPLLARSHLPLLSLRDAANPQPDQPVPAFFASL